MKKRSALPASIFLALAITGCTDAPIASAESVEPAIYQLRWTPPVARVDGSSLSEQDIAGYQIKWTRLQTGDTGLIEVGASHTSYLAELTGAEYAFEIAAIDKSGRLSRFVKPQ